MPLDDPERLRLCCPVADLQEFLESPEPEEKGVL